MFVAYGTTRCLAVWQPAVGLCVLVMFSDLSLPRAVCRYGYMGCMACVLDSILGEMGMRMG